MTSKIDKERFIFPENVYFVLGDGDSPSKMVFDIREAFESNEQYIDCFDHNGNLLNIFGRRLDECGSVIRDYDEETTCILSIRSGFVNTNPLSKAISV